MAFDVEFTQSKDPSKPATPGAARAEAPSGVVIPTPEEIASRARDTFAAMGWGEPPRSTQPPAVPEPAAPVAPAPAAPVAPVPPTVDAETLIARTATATATEVARALRPNPAPQPVAMNIDELGAEDREDYEAAVYLEKTFREHRGLGQRFVDYLMALYKYEEEWLSKNPDKEFNPDEPEHDQWFSDHPAPVDRKTLDDAKVDMRVDAKYEARVAPKMKQLDAERAWNTSRAEIFLVANRKVIEVIKIACPAIAAVLVDANGEPSLTEENAAKAEALDPVANDIINRTVARVWPIIVELEKTVLPGLDLKLNPANNAAHAEIIQFQESEEARILADPQERTKGGKRFVPVREWNTMNAGERDNCRTLTVDDVEAVIVREMAARAKKQIEYQDSLAAKKYGKAEKPNTTPVPSGREMPTTPLPGPRPAGLREPAPSLSSASEVVTTPGTAPARQKTYGEEAAAIHFR